MISGIPELVKPLPGKLGRALRDNVRDPSEKILVSLNPAMGEGIVVTDRRVLIIKAGAYTGKGLFAASSKSFYFPDISSVDLRIGPLGGHLQISTAGTREDREIAYASMSMAENAVTFNANGKDIMRQVADLIRSKVAEAKAPRFAIPAAQEQKQSIADELAKLAELHKSGILTDAEYEAAKKKLLGV